jgi:hypothetical protein
MADIKYNYKLNIKGTMCIDADGRITISVEDGGDYDLSALCQDFDNRLVKITVAYDEDYESPDVDVDTGEVI